MSGAAFGLPLHSFHFQKNKKLYVFESDILHVLLADSIISTAKRFREMKKLQFLKAGDYMLASAFAEASLNLFLADCD